MTEPIAVRVTRYQCPPCGRTHSSKRRAVEHIGRCWYNPGARGCKTCQHYNQFVPGDPDTGYPGEPESCAAGVDLAGRRACHACGGHGLADISSGAQVPCGPEFTAQHVGDGAEVKPGPVVHCDRWQPAGESA